MYNKNFIIIKGFLNIEHYICILSLEAKHSKIKIILC